MAYPKLVENLIEHLCQLPGVGRRSAERMVFWFLGQEEDSTSGLANSILQLKEKLGFCRRCNHLTEGELCDVCRDDRRDSKTICVVENPKDLIAIEKAGTYQGKYHVLLGAISPMEGRGPDDLKIQDLIERVRAEGITEVIIATDADTEGEMTALHLTKELRVTPVKVSRIGLGIPVGSSVEYVDLSTLNMSLNSRREIPVEETQ